MPTKKLRLSSFIKNMRNKEFMQLYLQLMQLTERYVATTKNEYIEGVYESMQKEVERVRQLDVKLNVASEAVKTRNEVHKDIKDSIGYIRRKVKAYELWYLQSYRAHAAYISDKLGGLIVLKSVSSITATLSTIAKIRQTVEGDINLANALLELDLMPRVEILYKQGEEFEQLDVQKNIDSVTAPVIDKKAIRSEATDTLGLLFTTIKMNGSLTNDDVWVEMAEEVREMVNRKKEQETRDKEIENRDSGLE